MITITKKDLGTSLLNCRPVQRTNRVTTDLINRNEDIYLVYFRNDMSGRVAYAYTKNITDYGTKRSNYQYSELSVTQVNKLAAQNVYDGEVWFNPAGHWYYIIYEVYFREGLSVDYEGQTWNMLSAGYAPIDNIGTYEEWGGDGPDPDGCRGVLGLAVEEGKLFVDGGDNITYTQHKQVNDNYIYTQ